MVDQLRRSEEESREVERSLRKREMVRWVGLTKK